MLILNRDLLSREATNKSVNSLLNPGCSKSVRNGDILDGECVFPCSAADSDWLPDDPGWLWHPTWRTTRRRVVLERRSGKLAWKRQNRWKQTRQWASLSSDTGFGISTIPICPEFSGIRNWRILRWCSCVQNTPIFQAGQKLNAKMNAVFVGFIILAY